jgi:23S rRNA pseudouridine1911/1915/1917 synthase
MEKIEIKTSPKDAAKRIDLYLAEHFLGAYSRTYLQRLIRDAAVLINDKPCKTNYKIRQNDRITVVFPEAKPSTLEPQDIPLEIIYEDEHLLVVNKPCGMVTHPGAGVKSGTLVNALLYHSEKLSGIGGAARPGIVHRLDKDTSGIMVVAKNDWTHRSLAKQFKQRKVQRKYIAMVKGVVELDNDRINMPIGKHPKEREKMAVKFADAKEAITQYRVLKRFSDSTLVEITPVTGRTHQIRVHMKAIGHPIIGDTKYGDGKAGAPRQMLHAQWIMFFHPKLKKYMEFSCSPAQQDGWLAGKAPFC